MIGGVSIILLLGIANMLLVLFQLLSGLRVIRVPMGVHRKTGIALAVFAALHGILAMLSNI